MQYSVSDNYLSSLYEPIVELLETHREGMTEYELMKELSHMDFPFLLHDSSYDDLDLFRSHFFLFHLLYRLRDRLIEERRYLLSIFCLEIKLHPFAEGEESRMPSSYDPLRAYYLDIDKMYEIEEEEVREMIEGFFRRIEAFYHMEEDLVSLGVGPQASYKEIQRSYRHLAFTHHPDRGGDAREFRRIQEAMRRVEKFHGRTIDD